MRSFKMVRKENNYVVSTRVVCQLEELVWSVVRNSDLTLEESQNLVAEFTKGGLLKTWSNDYKFFLELAD